MANFNQNNQGFSPTVEREAMDVGLRSYMLKVYNYMGLGLAFTAVIVLYMSKNPELMQSIAMGPMKWVLFAGVLGLGFFSPKLIFSGNKVLAHGAFWLYAALWGAMISPMVSYYLNTNPQLIIQALTSTVVVFGGMSLLGYTTKKNLSGFGTFFTMAFIGVIAISFLNLFFFESSLFSAIISGAVVLLIAGVTAYETQQIKKMYYQGGNTSEKAIFGAFMLYGSFITLFIHILNLLGFMNSD
ncbi:MAG: Bax inhibitor-1/YccA family protein [Rhizobiales bacterium]|nr:Bax inhibitor-1/YccA family protein [Hyphomicrobiales bacterium]